jgi:LPS export ABC transporter permease LptG
VGDVFNDLSDFLRNETTLATTVRYFLLKLPGNIRFVLPISLLLACMYTMTKFGRNQEITAMRASGISLQRCCVAIYLVALIVTGVNFWFNEKFVPYTEREAFLLRNNARVEDFQESLHSMLTYRSPDGLRIWLFKYFDAKGVQKDIILKHSRDDGTLAWDMKAGEAEYRPSGEWVFRNAVYTEYDAEGLLPGNSLRTAEMIRPVHEFSETPRDIENAVKPVDDLPSWVIFDLLRRTRDMSVKCSALYWTTLYYRLTFPWACLVAVFLGIPLAGRSHRGGFFLAVLAAVGIIIAYMLASNLFRVLGNQGHLPPFVAGAGPTLAFIAYGCWNVLRRE